MRGVVRATSTPGQGLQFHMQLPLTLSVVRALLVEIGGEPYAFPLARIDRTIKIHRDHIETMEGRQYFTLGNQHIGMLSANQVLELAEPAQHLDELPIVVLGERLDRYGLVVDRFLGERNLVVQTLDPRLGKIQDVGAAAILEDGSPCLIMDVDDLIRSMDILIAGGRLDRLETGDTGIHHHRGKRVLVVDDSITVREVERNMLASRGYAVDVAVDGMDGWNAVRTGHYDLVISDVDMPRMNGFEFVAHIKGDPALKSTPVMIVSYKDREEDRARGLEVGADYYLTKGSFHDETLLDAVLDLIGEA
jgi:two-component system sensor histidine kinase and response regulator WspE